jgi:hypothetical protein
VDVEAPVDLARATCRAIISVTDDVNGTGKGRYNSCAMFGKDVSSYLILSKATRRTHVASEDGKGLCPHKSLPPGLRTSGPRVVIRESD